MALNSNQRPPRSRSTQEMWPRWMWVAVPALGVVVGLGLYWALFSEPADEPAVPTMTPTMQVIESVPSLAATAEATVDPANLTPTRPSLPPLATFTPTPMTVTTPGTPVPTGEPTRPAAWPLAAKPPSPPPPGSRCARSRAPRPARSKRCPMGRWSRSWMGPKRPTTTPGGRCVMRPASPGGWPESIWKCNKVPPLAEPA